LAKLEDIYIPIFDKLKDIATNLQMNNQTVFKKVVQGHKTPVTTFPMCFILPNPDAVSPASTKKDKHVFRFIVAVVVEKADVETGLKDAVKVACAMYDELVKDRTLGGIADNLEITRIEYHWRRAPAFVRHWAALFVDVHKFYV